MKSVNKFHNFLSIASIGIYMILVICVVVYFPDKFLMDVLLFIIINLSISSIFFVALTVDKEYIFYMLSYFVFMFVYIFKGIIQYFSGLDTLYVLRTIRTEISDSIYLESLSFVSVSHIVLVVSLLILNKVFFKVNCKKNKNTSSNQTIGGGSTKFILYFFLFFIVVSSIIMFQFGVGVMGSEGVSLPFKLSGVFFYSRVVLIPLILLFLLSIYIQAGDTKQFRLTLLIFLLLSLSEIVVRASKAPLFMFALELMVLYVLLVSHGKQVNIKPKVKHIVLMISISILMWPLVEIYRTFIVFSGDMQELLVDIRGYDEQNVVIYSIQRLFQRLLGFLQLAGILSDTIYAHDIGKIFQYDSIARYYTVDYLGYTQKGHLSSPSLLGTFIMLYENLWWFMYFIFTILTFAMWKFSNLFGELSIAMKSMMSIVLFNVIMAGTIDFFVLDCLLIFLFASMTYIIFKSSTIKIEGKI